MKKKPSLAPLESALEALKESLSPPPRNDRERDGSIQRFEFTFELCWKTIQKALLSLGRSEVSGSPLPVLRDAVQEGFIVEIERWFEFLDARNLSTHVYNAEIAKKIFIIADQFPPYVEALLAELRKRLT